ncbi:MAG: sensor histidine kinase, partial [Bacteroidota bacterium]
APSESVKMMKERSQRENKMIKLEREKSMAELNFLKAQMNPHFLFNTLNNIYALAKNGSEQTADMILKLSEMLDYTLYECSQAKVPIAREWELIENYADLQSLRHADKLIVILEKELDDPSVEISPLLLISLVENAFKYALRNGENAPMIKISLSLKARRLGFEVFNTRNEEYVKAKPTGIGIKNLKGQLNLQYPERHKIEIESRKDSYQVFLQIDL